MKPRFTAAVSFPQNSVVDRGFTVLAVGLIETTYCYFILILRIARDGQAEKVDILVWLKYKRVVFTLTEMDKL